MLDTNICIYIIKNKPDSVLKKFETLTSFDVCISSIVLAELEYGAFKSKNPEKNFAAIDEFLSGVTIFSFNKYAAKEYGDIRAALEKQGLPIGMNDLLIAAHAKALNLILVTNNEREFKRIENLSVENWVQ